MVVSFCTRTFFLSRKRLLKIPIRKHGYTVLLPQIRESLVQNNPVVRDDNLPEFTNATVEKCVAAVLKQSIEMEETLKQLETVLKNNQNLHIFHDVIDPLEKIFVPLELSHGIVNALFFANRGLLPAENYKKIHLQAEAASHQRFCSPMIYQACLKAKGEKDPTRTLEEERVIDKYLLENTLNGVALSPRNKERRLKYFEFLRKHTMDFLDKVLFIAAKYTLKVDNPEIVKSFPEDLLQKLSDNPKKPHIGPWKVTFNPAVFNQFLEYCPDSGLRAQLWNAYITRCSQSGDRSLRTSVIVEEIRTSKQDVARILGFPTYVEFSMQTKMAGSKKNVLDTFDVLLEKAYPAQQRDFASLTEFRGTSADWTEYDLPFYIRKQREQLFPYDSENLHNYFPFRKVLSGFFHLVEHLYDIKIVESRKFDVWHKDVRYFEIFEGDNLTDPISGFYLDSYDAAIDKPYVPNQEGYSIIISRKSKIGNTKPLVALIFKFQKPVKEKPCLLTFQEVNILFQQFGHVMACLLNKGERADVSGHSFLEWDAAHIGDYFMNNWLYEPWVLKQVSGHYDTNIPIPDESINALRNIRNHFKAYELCKEMYWSHVDLDLFSHDFFWPKIVRGNWSKYFVFPQPEMDERILSHMDIVERFSAAYFSKLWSEMLAADIYSAFKEIPPSNTDQQKQLGKRYRDTFLASTGCYSTTEIFRRFRGRDPSPKALLKHFEIDATPKSATQ